MESSTKQFAMERIIEAVARHFEMESDFMVVRYRKRYILARRTALFLMRERVPNLDHQKIATLTGMFAVNVTLELRNLDGELGRRPEMLEAVAAIRTALDAPATMVAGDGVPARELARVRLVEEGLERRIAETEAHLEELRAMHQSVREHRRDLE